MTASLGLVAVMYFGELHSHLFDCPSGIGQLCDCIGEAAGFHLLHCLAYRVESSNTVTVVNLPMVFIE